MSACDYPRPEAGQVWEDNDRRAKARPPFVIESVDETYAYVSGPPRRSRILINRMRPTSTGYRLVRNADGTPYRSEETDHA